VGTRTRRNQRVYAGVSSRTRPRADGQRPRLVQRALPRAGGDSNAIVPVRPGPLLRPGSPFTMTRSHRDTGVGYDTQSMPACDTQSMPEMAWLDHESRRGPPFRLTAMARCAGSSISASRPPSRRHPPRKRRVDGGCVDLAGVALRAADQPDDQTAPAALPRVSRQPIRRVTLVALTREAYVVASTAHG
jgi:hypothetical protein